MKEIPNFSHYLADDQGFIYSVDYKRTGKLKVIKPSLEGGYYQSMFKRDDGKYCTVKIHKLIALAYYGEREKGKEINHINGIKTDNRPINLEYCTRSENCQHSFDMGLQKAKRGALNGMAKLTEAQVKEIREIAANGGRYWGRNKLARKYGVTAKHLQDIANNPMLWMR